MYQLRIKQS